MKKLKCESCGGRLIPDKSGEYAVCEYCGTKFKLKEDVNVNINYNGNNASDSEFNSINTPSRTAGIAIFVAMGIVMIIIVISGIVVSNKRRKSITKTLDQDFGSQIVTTEEESKNMISQFDIDVFNNRFEAMNGTQPLMFVKGLLDDINLSNQKNPDKIITVEYNETTTTDADEIRAIKNSLSKSEYEIIFEYGEMGYIEKVKIQ